MNVQRSMSISCKNANPKYINPIQIQTKSSNAHQWLKLRNNQH